MTEKLLNFLIYFLAVTVFEYLFIPKQGEHKSDITTRWVLYIVIRYFLSYVQME